MSLGGPTCCLSACVSLMDDSAANTELTREAAGLGVWMGSGGYKTLDHGDHDGQGRLGHAAGALGSPRLWRDSQVRI